MPETSPPHLPGSLLHDERRAYQPTEAERDLADVEPLPPGVYGRKVTAPELIWRGKTRRGDLKVRTDALFRVEQIVPEDVVAGMQGRVQGDLFGDEPLPPGLSTDYYGHGERWKNRMILGDSLLVMQSLADREGYRGKVQCVYMDPPYGISFASNWQPRTDKRDVGDKRADVSREPEVVQAYRDTWFDGIHSYLTYLRDRLQVAHALLRDEGSIFVQIGDENVHRVRALLDEVFGEKNFVSQIQIAKTTGMTPSYLSNVSDHILMYAKVRKVLKYNKLFEIKPPINDYNERYVCVEDDFGRIYDLSVKQKQGLEPLPEGRILKLAPTDSQGPGDSTRFNVIGSDYTPSSGRHWSIQYSGLSRVRLADYFVPVGRTLLWKNYRSDGQIRSLTNTWLDLKPSGFGEKAVYTVQTTDSIVSRCILLGSDPGDLVLDPTCGSGTTAHCAEKWGRRWITIDTSRVALALARRRVMTSQFPYWFLQDSDLGEAEARRRGLADQIQPGPHTSDVRKGFVVKTVPHVTLGSIARNEEIDVIAARHATGLEAALVAVRLTLAQPELEEWEVPRPDDTTPTLADDALRAYWKARLARRREMDASIRRRAENEKLHDDPYEDKRRVRVAGPFTVETLREAAPAEPTGTEPEDLPRSEAIRHDDPDAAGAFAERVLAAVRVEGLNNPADRSARVAFESVEPDEDPDLDARATFRDERGDEVCCALVIGPESGPVTETAITAAARAARRGQSPADVLFVLGFLFPPEIGDEGFRMGRVTIYPVRLSQELMMTDLKLSEKGGLFTLYGDPDVEILREGGNVRLRLRGMEVYNPLKSRVDSYEVRPAASAEEAEGAPLDDGDEDGAAEDAAPAPDLANDVACWFVDPDYDGRTFRIRQAYFLGADRPYARLAASLGKKDVLGGPVDPAAWAQIYSATSIPFPRPASGRVAVKAISHTGDEVLRVLRV